MQPEKLTDKIEQVIIDLGDTRDDITALMDDLWLEIDHTKADSIRQGSERMIAVVDAANAFRATCDDLGKKLRGFAPPPAPPQPTPQHDWFTGQQTLKTSQTWTYRRPSGFTLRGKQYPQLYTWSSLYERLLTILRDSDPKLFETLPDRSEFISSRNNPYISRDHTKLRDALKLSDTVFVETNLNANLMGDNIARVLRVFSVADTDVTFFVRR